MSDLADQLRLLEDARARILDPKHWTQGAVARMANGREVITTDEEELAVCWCALGSLIVSQHKLRVEHRIRIAAHKLLNRRTAAFAEGATIVGVNDGIGHAAVIQAYDEAIAELRHELKPKGGDPV